MGTESIKTKLRAIIIKDCEAQGHKMGHFREDYGGHRSFCKLCGLAMHFNGDSGKIWGDASSTTCVPKEVMKTAISR